MMPIFSLRQDLEDAVMMRLAMLLKSQNPSDGYLALVGPYNGEVDQTDGPEHFRRRVRGRWPAVLVFAGTADFGGKGVDATRFEQILTLELYVGSDWQGDREHRLRASPQWADDPTRDPGIYRILEDIRALLSGWETGVECVDVPRPSREDPLIFADDFTVWRLQFSVKMDAHALPRDYGAQKFLSYAIDGNEDGSATPPNPFVEANGDLT